MPETCQLFQTLWLHDPEFMAWAKPQGGVRLATQDLEGHHIFGGTSRLNRKTNLIRICQAVHRYAHIKQSELRIACLWKQMKLGVLNWDVLDECRDKRRKGCARGWVEVQQVSGVYAAMQRELLNAED